MLEKHHTSWEQLRVAVASLDPTRRFVLPPNVEPWLKISSREVVAERL